MTTHATFTDTHEASITGPYDIVRDYVSHRFPDAVIHGTNVNNGREHFGTFVGHDAAGYITARCNFTGNLVIVGQVNR